jgi:hypothetical protein
MQPVGDRELACQRQPERVAARLCDRISTSSIGRSSSLMENFTNGSSSFQRRNWRNDLRKASPIGGA